MTDNEGGNPTLQAIRTRRVVRAMTDQPVDRTQLEAVLDAARFAPSAGNRHLHRVVATADPATLRVLRMVSPGMIQRPTAANAICIDQPLAAEVRLRPDEHRTVRGRRHDHGHDAARRTRGRARRRPGELVQPRGRERGPAATGGLEPATDRLPRPSRTRAAPTDAASTIADVARPHPMGPVRAPIASRSRSRGGSFVREIAGSSGIDRERGDRRTSPRARRTAGLARPRPGRGRPARAVPRRARHRQDPVGSGTDSGGAGFAVAWGRCVEAEGAPAFWPWRQVLRTLGVPPETLLTGGGESSEDRFRLLDDVTEAVCAAAESNGLVVILDDLHWADELALLVLRHLADRVAGARLFVLAACREVEPASVLPRVLPDLLRSPAVERLDLRSFDLAKVRARCERRSRLHGGLRTLLGVYGRWAGPAQHPARHARLPPRERRLEDRPPPR